MATKFQKENRNLTTTVSSAESLKNAMKAQYGTIVIKGDYANKAASSLRKQHVGNDISTVSVVVGLFFAPALIAGIAGKLIMAEAKKYEIMSVEDSKVVLKRK